MNVFLSFNSIDFNNYMFIMMTLGQVHNMTHEKLIELTKMLWTFIKQL